MSQTDDDFRFSPLQEVLRLESSIADSQRAFEAEIYARQALLAELEEQKEVQKQLDEILTWVADLRVAWLKAGTGGFTGSFQEVLGSVHQLQDAVREICNKDPR